MSKVRLYVDEDAGEHAVVQGLRARGLDVLTTIEANRCGASDRDQLVFAVEHGRVIYTFLHLLCHELSGVVLNKVAGVGNRDQS